MALCTHELATLVNGVSQQAPQLRMSSQGDIMENINPSLVYGLRPRNPIVTLAKIGPYNKYNDGELTTHQINATERFFSLFYKNTIQVLDVLGKEKVVKFEGSGRNYVKTAKPSEALTATTVADYTFVVNRSIVTKEVPAVIAEDFGCLVFVKVANFQTDYSIQVNNISVSYSTPHGIGTVERPPEKISSANIASELANALRTKINDVKWVIDCTGSVIYIYNNYKKPYTVRVSDSRGDTQMILIKGAVQRFSDLPTTAKHNFKCLVKGDSNLEQDDYYVEFLAQNTTGIGQGVWTECAAPGVNKQFNSETMPHALIKNADGTFTFKPLAWAERQAGNENSCPTPSFIGRRISDIFFYRNRLGLLADDNVILSSAGDFFNFWNESARTLTDGDPIDYSASHQEVSGLRYAVAFQETLLLFADTNQFVLDSGDILSPSTAVIKHVSPYSINTNIRPVLGNKTIFFVTDSANHHGFAQTKEFYISAEYDRKEAADITAHVPKYLPSKLAKVVSSPDNGLVLVLGDAGDEIYIYKYYWSGTEKIQSAWFKYTLPHGCQCESMEVIDNTLYMFNEYSGNLYLEVLSLDMDVFFSNDDFVLLLDRQVDSGACTMQYNTQTNTTLVTLPHPVKVSEFTTVDKRTKIQVEVDKVQALTLEKQGGGLSTKLPLVGNMTSNQMVFGYLYTALYQFSQQFQRSDKDSGHAITGTVIRYRNWLINYGMSGFFEIQVHPHTNSPYTQTHVPFSGAFTSAVVDTSNNGIGRAILDEGQIRVAVFGRSDETDIQIKSINHLPFTLLSAVWTGDAVNKGGRLI